MDLLPSELKKLIVDFLDDRSRFCARLTNTEWFKIINYDDFIFYDVTREQLPTIIERMSKSSHPIGITFQNPRLNTVWSKSNTRSLDEFFTISRLTNLTKLAVLHKEVDWPISEQWILLTTLTNLQCLDVQDRYQLSYRTLLPYLPNITKLIGVDDSLLSHLTVLTNLQSLDFEFWHNNAEIFEHLKFPEKLTSLVAFSTGGTLKLDVDLVTRLTGLKHLLWIDRRQVFPHSLLPNLESLNVRGAIADRLDLNTNLTQLQLADPHLRPNELTCLTKLISLTVNYNTERLIPPMEFLTALTDLEELNISGQYAKFKADLVCPFIMTTKLKHISLLTAKVEISSAISRLTMLESVAINDGWYLNWLTHLTNMTMLQSLYSKYPSAEYISHLTKLKDLTLDNKTNLNMIKLADLTNLEQLKLRITVEAPYCINGLDSLTRLTNLGIHTNEDFDMSGLAKMTDLQSLDLSSAKSKGFWQCVTMLTRLKSLTIRDLNGDEDVLSLKPFTQLARLALQGTVATEVVHAFKHIYNFSLK